MFGEGRPDLSRGGGFIPRLLAYTICANESLLDHLGIDSATLASQHCPCWATFKGNWTLHYPWVVTVWVGVLKPTC